MTNLHTWKWNLEADVWEWHFSFLLFSFANVTGYRLYWVHLITWYDSKVGIWTPFSAREKVQKVKCLAGYWGGVGGGGGCRRSGVSQWVIHKPNNLNKTNVINIVFMQTSEVIYQHRWTNSQHHHNFNCGNKQSFLSNRMVTKDKSRNSNIHRLN